MRAVAEWAAARVAAEMVVAGWAAVGRAAAVWMAAGRVVEG